MLNRSECISHGRTDLADIIAAALDELVPMVQNEAELEDNFLEFVLPFSEVDIEFVQESFQAKSGQDGKVGEHRLLAIEPRRELD